MRELCPVSQIFAGGFSEALVEELVLLSSTCLDELLQTCLLKIFNSCLI